MNRLLSRVRYVLVSLMFVGTMTATSLTPVFANSSNGGGNPNPPANNGTLKIHEQGTTSGTEDNDPKVCVFNVEGFGFDAAQSGYLKFSVQGGDGPTGTPAGPYSFGPTNASGYYASQYFNLDPGHYKATLYGKDTGGLINLADEKAKSKVFKVTCTTVTPATVTFNDQCGTANDTYTIPSTTGVDYKVGGVTKVAGTYAAAGTVTVTAVAQTNYNLTGTTQWSHAFTNVPCEVVLTPVTPATVTFDEKCELANDKFTIPSTTGVVYKIGGQTIAAGTYDAYDYDVNGTVTVTAEALPTYVLTGTATWSHTFTNVACPCGCEEQKEVTAPDVKFRDKCGLENDTFVIPSRVGVTYKVNNEVIAAGTWNAHDYDDENHEVVVTAHAASSHYKLVGDNEWSHTFTNEKCKVRADKPMFEDKCEVKNDTFTIPDSEHVYYKVGNVTLAAGTYNAHDYDDENHTVVVKAYAKEGYDLKKKDTWSFTYTNLPCGGQGGDNEVTPAVVTFNDLCETVNDTYTIPSTAGVVYKIGGNVVAAGTYNGTGTVTVTAEATSGHVLKGTATWSHTFTNVACATGGGGGGGFVLGDTFTPTPVVAPQPQVLADTGASSVTSTLVAVFVLITALAVYAFNPKFETR